MDKKYTVNNIYNDNGIFFNDLVSKLFTSFLDEDLNIFENHDIMNVDTILNL